MNKFKKCNRTSVPHSVTGGKSYEILPDNNQVYEFTLINNDAGVPIYVPNKYLTPMKTQVYDIEIDGIQRTEKLNIIDPSDTSLVMTKVNPYLDKFPMSAIVEIDSECVESDYSVITIDVDGEEYIRLTFLEEK